MWVCKKCNHENKEYDRSCRKCYKQRTYPPNYSRYFAMTSILTAILMPTILLLSLYEWGPIIVIGGGIYLIYFMCFINGDQMKTHEVLANLSSIILSIALAFLAYEYKEYVNINLYTILSSIIAFSSLPALIIYFQYEGKKEKIALQKAIEEEKIDRKKQQ